MIQASIIRNIHRWIPCELFVDQPGSKLVDFTRHLDILAVNMSKKPMVIVCIGTGYFKKYRTALLKAKLRLLGKRLGFLSSTSLFLKTFYFLAQGHRREFWWSFLYIVGSFGNVMRKCWKNARFLLASRKLFGEGKSFWRRDRPHINLKQKCTPDTEDW